MFDRPRIIPTLLIDNRKLVKTIRFNHPNYLGDPINAVKIFNEKLADELCILDISKNRKDIDYSFLHDLATEAFMPLSYGGGITSVDQVKKLFKIGFEKVTINSGLFFDPSMVQAAVKYAGSQSIVASIDIKETLLHRKRCFICNGSRNTRVAPIDMARKAEELGVGEIFLNSIDRDGMMNGYDLDMIHELSSALSIPMIACGGAGSLEDIKRAIDVGAQAVAAGSIFVYYGAKKAVLINYPTETELSEAGIFTI